MPRKRIARSTMATNYMWCMQQIVNKFFWGTKLTFFSGFISAPKVVEHDVNKMKQGIRLAIPIHVKPCSPFILHKRKLFSPTHPLTAVAT